MYISGKITTFRLIMECSVIDSFASTYICLHDKHLQLITMHWVIKFSNIDTWFLGFCRRNAIIAVNQRGSAALLTWMSLGMTSVPFLVLCAAAALLTYFFSRKKVTSQLMKATRGARYWSLVQKVLSLFLVTGTYRGFGLWCGRSSEWHRG